MDHFAEKQKVGRMDAYERTDTGFESGYSSYGEPAEPYSEQRSYPDNKRVPSLDSHGSSQASTDSSGSSYSSRDKVANRDQESMDSGLGSMSSSHSSSSSGCGSHTQAPKTCVDDFSTSSQPSARSGTKITVEEPVAKFACFVDFVQYLVTLKPKWTDWTPNTDIRENLTKELVEEGRKLLWDQPEDQDGDL